MATKIQIIPETTKRFGIYLSFYFSPHPVFLFAVVDERAVPAVGAADGGDDFLILWGDEAEALAYLEILGAAEVPDEFLTDVVLHAARHVVVEVRHALFLHDPGIWTELHALFAADLRIAGVDGLLGERQRVGILSDEPAQTLFFQRTALDETHQVVMGLLTEGLLLRLRRLLLIIFLCLHFIIVTHNLGANLILGIICNWDSLLGLIIILIAFKIQFYIILFPWFTHHTNNFTPSTRF